MIILHSTANTDIYNLYLFFSSFVVKVNQFKRSTFHFFPTNKCKKNSSSTAKQRWQHNNVVNQGLKVISVASAISE